MTLQIVRYIKGCPQNGTLNERLQRVIKNLLRLGIRANYDHVESKDNRLILYSSRYNSANYYLARECNGLILDYTT
jgi:hypothetical protein